MADTRQTNPRKDNELVPDELAWIDKISRLLDSKFRIPYTSITFGIDPIIGLIPYFGEVVTFSISGLLVLSMIRHGASREVVFKMLLNLGLDAAAGLVPGIGDIFDVFFKANRRNYELLKQHQLEGKHKGKGWGLLIGASILILLMLGCMIWGMVVILQWAIGLF